MPIKTSGGNRLGLGGEVEFPGFSRTKLVAVQFASRLSLIAFATVSIRGLIAGTDFQGTIQTALIAMAAFYGLGLIFGELARRVIEENVHAEIARLRIETAELDSEDSSRSA
jgi:hypothetical protein